jgi:hypothetical protein
MYSFTTIYQHKALFGSLPDDATDKTCIYLSSIDADLLADNENPEDITLDGFPVFADWSERLKDISNEDVQMVWDTLKIDLRGIDTTDGETKFSNL